jgi:hypothetical protein
MRILNFAKFSRCYSTIKKPRYTGESDHHCGLHRGVHKKFVLIGVGYTCESRLPGVAYTGESLVQA